MKANVIISAFLCLFVIADSFSQAGSLDPSFGGGDGQVSTNFIADLPCQAYGIAIQKNGKVIISGVTRGANDSEYPVVACYHPDGTLDNSFNGNGKMIISIPGANAFSQAVAIQPDSNIIVAARAERGDTTLLYVYRFHPDGSPDISFGNNGIVVSDLFANSLSCRAMAIQPDGKILVGGYIGFDVDTFDRFYMVRYLADGTPDLQFHGDGVIMTRVGESWTSISSILIQPDGKILAAGSAVFDGYDAYVVVRYHANGALDQSFGENGITKATFEEGDDRALDAVLQPDGKIVLGGSAFSNVTGSNDFGAARFNPDGTLDPAFHGDGMASVMVTTHADQARTILLQPDGKIVLGGFAHSNLVSIGAEMAMARLNSNGIPDMSFDDDGIAIYEDVNTSGEIYTMALQEDAKIIGAGFIRTDGLNEIRVARILTGLTVSTKDQNNLLSESSVFPNPAVEQVNVEYNLEQAARISIGLYDLQGRMISELQPPLSCPSGPQSQSFKLGQQVLNGTYIICLFGDGKWIGSSRLVVCD